MDADSRGIILVVLFFIASAYFALAETALASVSKNRIKVLSDKGNRKADKVLYILDHFEDAITTLLICTNIAHIAAASIITAVVTRKWGLSWVSLSTILTTLAMFFFCEMLPKSIGKKISVKASLFCSGLLVVLMRLLKPFSQILSGIGFITLKIFHAEEDEVSVTEDEIYDIIEDMTEEGTLDAEQSELISSALSFGDIEVSSILTPRVDVTGFDINMNPEEVLDFLMNQTHSRVVVYDKTIDNVVGVLRIRKYLKAYITRKNIPDVRKLVDEVYYCHASMQIDELLDNMTSNRMNMAVILDGFGGMLGIVTIEDILEEIVGEIWDESDEIVEPVVKISDDEFLVSADETVLDAFEYISFEIPKDEDEERFINLLISDWTYENFGKIPKEGESFNYHNLVVTVKKLEHNRIINVTIKVLEENITDEEVEE